MIVCIQKVSRAEVRVDGKRVSGIGRGLLLLVGIESGDTEEVLPKAAEKIVNLRLFPDNEQRMNRSVLDVEGEILLVSQFTLAGNIRKGRRPSFDNAAPPDKARELIDRLKKLLANYPVNVRTGVFQALMDVELVNEGPVTFISKW